MKGVEGQMANPILWTDWQGETYGFCSVEHADMFRESTEDPAAPRPDPKLGARFGCCSCGEDLTQGTDLIQI